MNGVPEGVWGPTAVGRARAPARRWLLVVAAVVGVLVVVAFGVGASLYRVAETNLERVDLPALAEPTSTSDPLNVLVVGSDSRSGLTEQQRLEWSLGPEFQGQRGDTVILVSITPDREDVSVVSFPRDLRVVDGDRARKLTETFADGPDHVVQVIQDTTGIPIHHYVEVDVLGFITVVDAVGGVEICLDQPLRDELSGADFDAGCREMSPKESLAYVRSRHTQLGDFDRISRQQTFMRALLDRMVATRTLVDVPRLFRMVDRVSSNVTTDSGLGVGEIRVLARELRGLAEGDVPMSVVPSYTRTIDNKSYVVPYEPGAVALFEAIRDGRPIASRGTRDERRATGVLVWARGRPGAAELVSQTLYWSAYAVQGVSGGPPEGAGPTVVYAAPGQETRAQWVAATLGASVAPAPADVALPDGVQVIVAVGDDAVPDDGQETT